MGIEDFVSGDQCWTHRGEGIERLAHRPLAGAVLIITGAYVIDRHLARDIIQCGRFRYIAAPLPDHNAEFRLVIDLRTDPGQPNRLTIGDHRIRVFAEYYSER